MPRTNFINTGRAMDVINDEVQEYASTHSMPSQWFMSQPTALHPVNLSAARKLLILAPRINDFLNDICQV